MISRRAVLGALAGAAAPAFAQRRRPNVIVFLTDDHGYHDLGCQGARELKTPNIDALASSGVRFTNWYSNAPMCQPSRAALMTGRYPIRAGVPQNGSDLPVSEVTVAQLLREHGYATGAIGKWHLGAASDRSPNAKGFDYFYGFHSGCIDFYSHRMYWSEPRRVNFHDLWRDRTEIFEDGQYFTELVTREATAFVNRAGSRPFLLYVPFNAVHYPMHAPRKYVERFPGLEPERQMYAAMLSAADDSIGEILAAVRKAGQIENTLVFFTSDNGATREPRAGLNQQPAKGGSNYPHRGFKFSLFDGGIRVPAIMSWPGVIPARQVVDEIAGHFDILPTVAAAAGVKLPAGRTIDGRDAMPRATSKAKSPHQALYWASEGQRAIRRGQWKLVLNGIDADGAPRDRRPLEGEDGVFLSNIEQDPGESRNLRRQHDNVAAELTGMLDRWSGEVKNS